MTLRNKAMDYQRKTGANVYIKILYEDPISRSVKFEFGSMFRFPGEDDLVPEYSEGPVLQKLDSLEKLVQTTLKADAPKPTTPARAQTDHLSPALNEFQVHTGTRCFFCKQREYEIEHKIFPSIRVQCSALTKGAPCLGWAHSACLGFPGVKERAALPVDYFCNMHKKFGALQQQEILAAAASSVAQNRPVAARKSTRARANAASMAEQPEVRSTEESQPTGVAAAASAAPLTVRQKSRAQLAPTAPKSKGRGRPAKRGKDSD